MSSSSQLAGLNRNGRKAGTPNKFTASIKEMVEHALHKAGGVEYLTNQAHANPVAFLGLVGKVLPLQINTNSGDTLAAQHFLAATAMGLQLAQRAIEQQQQPSNGHSVTIETTVVDLNAPPPEE